MISIAPKNGPVYKTKMRFLVIGLALALCSTAAGAQETVGRTAVVVERVDGTLQDKSRQLAIRDDVHLQELIQTYDNSGSEIVFLDGTQLALGPGTRMTLTRYVYDPRPSRQKMSVQATKGVFRFVTGAFSKTAYEVDTPTTTIGVRGTQLLCRADAEYTYCEVTEGVAILTDKTTGQVHVVRAGENMLVGSPSGSFDRAFADFASVLGTNYDARLIRTIANIPYLTLGDVERSTPMPFFGPASGLGSTGGGAVLIPSGDVVSPSGLRGRSGLQN